MTVDAPVFAWAAASAAHCGFGAMVSCVMVVVDGAIGDGLIQELWYLYFRGGKW